MKYFNVVSFFLRFCPCCHSNARFKSLLARWCALRHRQLLSSMMKCRNILSLNVVIFCVYGILTETYQPWARPNARVNERGRKGENETTVAAILSVSKIYGGMSFVRLCHHYFYFCRHLFHHQDTQKESIVTMRSISFVISAFVYVLYVFFSRSTFIYFQRIY